VQAIDFDCYGPLTSGTGEGVVEQIGDAISSWLATHD
jgi:hypothetical protein